MNPIPYSVLVLAVSLIIHQQTSAPRVEQLRNLIHDPKIVDNVSGPSPIPTGTPHRRVAKRLDEFLVSENRSAEVKRGAASL